MLLRATRLGDLRRSTLRWCRRNRTSACNAARDRNSPITADQINLQRSLIGRKYQPIRGRSSAALTLRWGQLSHNDIQHWVDRFLAALEREPTALSQLEKMPSAESLYRRLARLLLADFEYRRGYKFANTVRHFRGGVRRSTVMHLSSRKPGLTQGLVSPVVRIRNHGSDRNGGYGAKLVR